jgi:hypothetical protein
MWQHMSSVPVMRTVWRRAELTLPLIVHLTLQTPAGIALKYGVLVCSVSFTQQTAICRLVFLRVADGVLCEVRTES